MEKGWLGSEFKRGWIVITTDLTLLVSEVLLLYLTPFYTARFLRHSDNRFDT